jgi:hypothetical protein
MNLPALESHVNQLKQFAAATATRAANEPDDFVLQLMARSQAAAAEHAELQYLQELGSHGASALEWRLVGERAKNGHVPMGLMARLSDALNRLLLKASFFARAKEDPSRGVGEGFAQEMNLKFAGLAEGSARLFIVGNTFPDTTGSAPLADAMGNVLSALSSGNDPSTFYDALGDLGEQASSALHDALKAMEQEECSVEVNWRAHGEVQTQALRFDEIVRMRSLLEGADSNEFEDDEVAGLIGLLALTGRIQVIKADGQKTNVRFKPKTQGQWVAKLRLGQAVSLRTRAKILRDPLTGEETRLHRLVDTDL